MAIKIIEKRKIDHRVFRINCTCGCVFECDETDIDVKKARDLPLTYVYGEINCPECGKVLNAETRHLVFDNGKITQRGIEVGYVPESGEIPEKKEKPDYFKDEENMHNNF